MQRYHLVSDGAKRYYLVPWLLLVSLWLVMLATARGEAQSPERACTQVRINAKGTSGAVVTVDATAGGIVVADANTSRCFLWINNDTTNAMRCAPSTGPYALVVSATVGFLWPASPAPLLGWAAQEQWKCFRTTGTSATVSIMEGLP